MSISTYSITMAVIWFSIAALIGSFTLRRITNGGLLYVAIIFLLAIIRGIMPYEFSQSIILRSKTWYPFLQSFVRLKLVHSLTIGSLLLYIWFAGAVVFLFLTIRKLFLLNKFRSSSPVEPESSEFVQLAQDVSAEFGYSGSVSVYLSDTSTTAYQAGFLQPFVILPANLSDFSDTEIRSMLRHELAHFLGNDLWIKCAVRFITCALWWNPAAALLNSGIEQMLELRCDKRACMGLSSCDQVSYMETLLHLAKTNAANTRSILSGYIGTNEEARIIQRFNRIRSAKSTARYDIRTVISLFLSVLLFVGSYFITIQPWNDVLPTTGIHAESPASIENYIIHRSDDTYELYIDNEFIFALHEDELTQEPFCEYIIYEGGYPHETTPYIGN